MESKDLRVSPERVETDSSLRVERKETDHALTRRAAVVEAQADRVVAVARERADGVVDVAREKADAIVQGAGAPGVVEHAVRVARTVEDRAVTRERAAADRDLRVHREETRDAPARLLAAERAQTDDRLLAERIGSDRAVATRDEFLAMVSHDVRGLLSGIALSAGVLVQATPDRSNAERIHREAGRIAAYAGRMNRLISDLLDVVSMEMGKVHVDATLGDAKVLLTETTENFGPKAAARAIRLGCEGADAEAWATFDHERILQVLSNLVDNALRFSHDGGTVILGLVPHADGVEFTVRDHGRGIAADQREAIFERFSQAGQPDRRGLGLGLYIARCIVEAHDGRIWVESELDRGSTFHFTLPKVRAHGQPRPA